MVSLTKSQPEDRQIRVVWRSYCKWFFVSAALASLASAAAYGVNHNFPFNALWINILQIAGAVIEATALGQCGLLLKPGEELLVLR